MSIMTRNRAVQPRTAGTDDTAADRMSGDTIRASHSPSPHTGLEEMFPSQGNITGDKEDGPSGLPSNCFGTRKTIGVKEVHLITNALAVRRR